MKVDFRRQRFSFLDYYDAAVFFSPTIPTLRDSLTLQPSAVKLCGIPARAVGPWGEGPAVSPAKGGGTLAFQTRSQLEPGSGGCGQRSWLCQRLPLLRASPEAAAGPGGAQWSDTAGASSKTQQHQGGLVAAASVAFGLGTPLFPSF